MRFSIFNPKISLLLTVIAIHSSIREFLYRVPFFIWFLSVAILLPLISPSVQKRFSKTTNFFEQKIKIVALSILFFSTFLQMKNSNSFDYKFENVSKFLSFFDETKLKMFNNIKNLDYLQPTNRQLIKPKHKDELKLKRYEVSFGGRIVSSKLEDLDEKSNMMFCDEVFKNELLKIADITKKGSHDLKKKYVKRNLLSNFSKLCMNSIYYKKYASYLNNHTIKKQEKEILKIGDEINLTPEANVPTIDDIWLDSMLTMASRQGVEFISLKRWEKNWNDCSIPLKFIPSFAADLAKDAILVIYPNQLLYPTYLEGENSNLFFELNNLKRDESVICVLETGEKLNLQRIVVEI